MSHKSQSIVPIQSPLFEPLDQLYFSQIISVLVLDAYLPYMAYFRALEFYWS